MCFYVGGFMPSYIRIFLFVCLSALCSLATPGSSFASDDGGTPRPYKATTVDECIEEKECVWHAFGSQLGIFDYTKWVISGKSLHKWNKDVRFSAIGNAPKYLGVLSLRAIEPLKRVFPYGITPGKPPVYLMVFTDNKDVSLLEWQSKLSQRQLGQTRSKIKFNKMNNVDEGCYSLSMSHVGSNDISTVLTIVDTKSDNTEYCMVTHFFSAFGFWGYEKKQPFSFLSGSAAKKAQFTKLDKFLLFLLYQPEFKSGQQFPEIKKVFDSIYMDTKHEFLELEKGDE